MAGVLIVSSVEPQGTEYVVCGNTVRASASTQELGSRLPVDPDELSLTIQPPYSTPTTWVWGTDAELIRDSQGVFHADVPIDTAHPGKWRLEWEASVGSDPAATTSVLTAVAA